MRRLLPIRFTRSAVLVLLVALVGLLALSGTAWAGRGDYGSPRNPRRGTVPPRRADVAITKSGTWLNNDITFTIVVSNKGPMAARNVIVTDRLATRLTYLSYTASKGSCTFKEGFLNCYLGDLKLDEQVTIQVQTHVNSTRATRITNRAVVRSVTPDSSHKNNVAQITVKRP